MVTHPSPEPDGFQRTAVRSLGASLWTALQDFPDALLAGVGHFAVLGRRSLLRKIAEGLANEMELLAVTLAPDAEQVVETDPGTHVPWKFPIHGFRKKPRHVFASQRECVEELSDSGHSLRRFFRNSRTS